MVFLGFNRVDYKKPMFVCLRVDIPSVKPLYLFSNKIIIFV